MILNIIKYGISEGLAKIAPFLTTLYVAKFLSPEVFGKYSLILVMFEISFIIISFNIQATTRIDYFKEDSDSFNSIKQNHFILSVFIALLGLFAIFFVEEKDRIIVAVLLLSALMRTGSVFILAIFQCSKRVNAYIVTNVLFVTILSGLTYTLVNMGASFYSWLYAMFFASAIQLVLAMRLYGFKQCTVYFPQAIRLDTLKIMFIPAVLFMPQAIGWWLKSGADRIIISEYLGDTILGEYALAFQFSSLLLVLVTIINLAFVPELNRLLKAKDKLRVREILRYASLFVILSCLLVGVFGYAGIVVFYAVDYKLSLTFFYFLIIAMLPQALMLLNINILYYNGNGKFVAKLILLSFLGQTLANLIIIQYYNVTGMILCSLVINLFVLKLVINKKNKILM
jgi:O-antigen/teichoic acid export membrane protein